MTTPVMQWLSDRNSSSWVSAGNMFDTLRGSMGDRFWAFMDSLDLVHIENHTSTRPTPTTIEVVRDFDAWSSREVTKPLLAVLTDDGQDDHLVIMGVTGYQEWRWETYDLDVRCSCSWDSPQYYSRDDYNSAVENLYSHVEQAEQIRQQGGDWLS